MGGRRAVPAVEPISESLLLELRKCLAERRIEDGFGSVRSQAQLLSAIDERGANAAEFVGHLAQWVDVGAFDPFKLKEVLRRFDAPKRAALPFRDFLFLRMADGMYAMSQEEIDSAIKDFSFVLEFPDELRDPQSISIANFWKARCLRRRGEYEQALEFAHRGRDTALALGAPKMAALSQVLESWLLFQKGKLKEAENVSHHAEAVLRQTDDYVTLGNIYSFYGRVARRSGRYDKAIECFNRAIAEYRKRDPQHPNLARSLANIALAKREIALQLRRKIDRQAERRRKQAEAAKAESNADSYRRRLQALHQEIIDHLDEASEIYSHHPNHHGIGTVELNYSYVLLDDGDYHGAESKARHAYKLGEEKQDFILMGRARVVLCMIENARVEEEISEGSDPGSHARRAMEYIQEAIDFAKHTQNQRLLANAYLWLGFTQCNAYFDDTDAAREAYELALASRKITAQADNMAEELQRLKAKVVSAGSMDLKFKAWSQGSLGDKTFQELTEEFAELIIPQVWEREGRKVSRVAARLSISPKKVRRILDRVGRRKPR
jgi:tetratricopeptide (TPR) repeat protein